jgi:hypothetical protein
MAKKKLPKIPEPPKERIVREGEEYKSKYRILKKDGKYKVRIKGLLFWYDSYYDSSLCADFICNEIYYFKTIKEAEKHVEKLIRAKSLEKKKKSKKWKIIKEY